MVLFPVTFFINRLTRVVVFPANSGRTGIIDTSRVQRAPVDQLLCVDQLFRLCHAKIFSGY